MWATRTAAKNRGTQREPTPSDVKTKGTHLHTLWEVRDVPAESSKLDWQLSIIPPALP